jgi:hypothetical protein
MRVGCEQGRAVNRLEWGAFARERVLSRGSDDKLDLKLQPVLNLVGFSLGIP